MNYNMLTKQDLIAIGKVVDERLEVKLEEKLEEQLTKKLQPIYNFIDFAKTALLELLDESQEQFEQKIPERLKKLEDIHPGGQHSS